MVAPNVDGVNICKHIRYTRRQRALKVSPIFLFETSRFSRRAAMAVKRPLREGAAPSQGGQQIDNFFELIRLFMYSPKY